MADVSQSIGLFRSFIFFLAAIAIGAACGAEPTDNDQSQKSDLLIKPVLIPGGIADLAGKLAYVANDRAGLDVLSLDGGKQLWTVADIRAPLIVVGDRLVAQAPAKDKPRALRLVVLDATKSGPILVESDVVALPEWVSLDKELAKSFTLQVRAEGTEVVVGWRADAWYAGDLKMSDEQLQARRKAASGQIHFDLATGKTESTPHAKPRQLSGPFESRDATLGNLRLLLGETASAAGGDFSRSIKRMLRATDAKTGKSLWEHPLAPEVVIPAAR